MVIRTVQTQHTSKIHAPDKDKSRPNKNQNFEMDFQEERKMDVTGLLYREACRGFKISKRNINLQNEIHNKKLKYTLKEF